MFWFNAPIPCAGDRNGDRQARGRNISTPARGMDGRMIHDLYGNQSSGSKLPVGTRQLQSTDPKQHCLRMQVRPSQEVKKEGQPPCHAPAVRKRCQTPRPHAGSLAFDFGGKKRLEYPVPKNGYRSRNQTNARKSNSSVRHPAMTAFKGSIELTVTKRARYPSRFNSRFPPANAMGIKTQPSVQVPGPTKPRPVFSKAVTGSVKMFFSTVSF